MAEQSLRPRRKKSKHGEALAWLNENINRMSDDCLEWPFSRLGNGYAAVRYDGRVHTVSRIVCEKLYGPPPEPWYEAAHSCGRGHEGCVAGLHLSWKTPADNRADKKAHGTHVAGAGHRLAKLSSDQVAEIRSIGGREKQSTIARRYGVSRNVICRILGGLAYLST